MHKYFTIPLFLLLFVACGDKKTVGEFVANIESKSNIGDLTAEEFDPSWIPVQEREAFLTSFFKGVKDGKYDIFEYLPGEFVPMSASDLKYLLHHVDTEFVEDENGDLKMIELEEVYDPSGVVFFKFKEDLFFDAETGRFDKEIKYVCPMEKVYNEDGSTRGYRGLFWAKLKK